MKLLKADAAADPDDEHPIDRHYRQLACDIRPLDDSHPTVQLVREYVERTHGRTHTAFALEVEQVGSHATWTTESPHSIAPPALSSLLSGVLYIRSHCQVYEVDRKGEGDRYVAHADNDNRMLLWHGSRLSNFTGILSQVDAWHCFEFSVATISEHAQSAQLVSPVFCLLSQGLRIAPPEAPATGHTTHSPRRRALGVSTALPTLISSLRCRRSLFRLYVWQGRVLR